MASFHSRTTSAVQQAALAGDTACWLIAIYAGCRAVDFTLRAFEGGRRR
jgi:hypothetical protein